MKDFSQLVFVSSYSNQQVLLNSNNSNEIFPIQNNNSAFDQQVVYQQQNSLSNNAHFMGNKHQVFGSQLMANARSIQECPDQKDFELQLLNANKNSTVVSVPTGFHNPSNWTLHALFECLYCNFKSKFVI